MDKPRQPAAGNADAAVVKLEELIARLEAAPGPNRQLNLDIANACKISWSSDEDGNFGGYSIMPRRVRFTESIDAAITLVPDGLDYVLRSLRNNAEARVGCEKDRYMIKGGQHPVPAIALCIASLKARAAIAKATGAAS